MIAANGVQLRQVRNFKVLLFPISDSLIHSYKLQVMALSKIIPLIGQNLVSYKIRGMWRSAQSQSPASSFIQPLAINDSSRKFHVLPRDWDSAPLKRENHSIARNNPNIPAMFQKVRGCSRNHSSR